MGEFQSFQSYSLSHERLYSPADKCQLCTLEIRLTDVADAVLILTSAHTLKIVWWFVTRHDPNAGLFVRVQLSPVKANPSYPQFAFITYV